MMCELFNPILDAQNEVTWIWLKKNVHCNVFLDIFSQEIPLLILSYFRVAADFVKKVLGFVYKGSDAQLCITTFVICFEGLWVTTWYYFFSLCELILNLTKNLEEIHLRIMTVTSKKLVYCLGVEPPKSWVKRKAQRLNPFGHPDLLIKEGFQKWCIDYSDWPHPILLW